MDGLVGQGQLRGDSRGGLNVLLLWDFRHGYVNGKNERAGGTGEEGRQNSLRDRARRD